MSEAKPYHHGNLRQDLLAASMSLLDQGGIESVGIRQVAKSVGVAHSAPANHFKNKGELLIALNQMIVEQLILEVKEAMNSRPEEEEPIQHFLNTMLDYGLKYPNRYKLVWRSDYELLDSMEEIYQILTGILQVYSRKKAIDVETQAIAVWSLVHGYVALRIDGYLSTGADSVTGKERQRAIVDVILDGIR